MAAASDFGRKSEPTSLELAFIPRLPRRNEELWQWVQWVYRSKNEAGLIFEGVAGNQQTVRSDTLCQLIIRLGQVRCVFLNACLSARFAGGKIFSNLGEALVDQGLNESS